MHSFYIFLMLCIIFLAVLLDIPQIDFIVVSFLFNLPYHCLFVIVIMQHAICIY